MRIYRVVSAAIGGVVMVGVNAAVMAGPVDIMAYESGSYQNTCRQTGTFGYVSAGGSACNSHDGLQNTGCNGRIQTVGPCSAPLVNHASAPDPLAPINVYDAAPYGYLKTFAYKNTPNVNVMRVHARAPQVAITDVPTSFTAGCNTASTGYCRQAVVAPTPRPIPRPVYRPIVVAKPVVRFAPRPIVPKPRYVAPAPVFIAPVQPSVPTCYSPVKFTPPPQCGAGWTTNHTPSHTPSHSQGAINFAPTNSGNVIGQVSGGSYTYQPAGGGSYWEKTSGPTLLSGLPATQILCRREAPRPAPVTVNVVRPVIGVPQPVPTPTCGLNSYARMGPQAMMRQHMMQPTRYSRQEQFAKQGQMPASRWTY